jgi:hypothetical protein
MHKGNDNGGSIREEECGTRATSKELQRKVKREDRKFVPLLAFGPMPRYPRVPPGPPVSSPSPPEAMAAARLPSADDWTSRK